MTSSNSTNFTWRQQVFGLVLTVFLLMTTLAAAPSADAQSPVDYGWKFELVTRSCADTHTAWANPYWLEGAGTICYQWNTDTSTDPAERTFRCAATVDGRTQYPDVVPGYDVSDYPELSVLSGCYYYPGVTFQRTFVRPSYWAWPSFNYTW